MHAYLILSSSPKTLHKKITELVPGVKQIIPFSIAKITDTRELITETSTSFSQKTAYLLEDFDEASLEAQSAFLKSLEEAQENIVYVLTAKSEEAVLPTVVSRCQVIRPRKASPRGKADISFVEKSISERFVEISKISKREDAVAFLETLLSGLHDNLPKNPSLARVTRAADMALTRINRNANPTLQLTRLATHI